jgi:hypothetical protein
VSRIRRIGWLFAVALVAALLAQLLGGWKYQANPLVQARSG